MNNLDKNVFLSGSLPEAGDANSYLIKNAGKSGNWLINSPKFDENLIEEIKSYGGITHIFATHRDVISYASELAKMFNAKRIIHEGDLDAIPDAEIVLHGNQPQVLADDKEFLAIPTPGHTEGSSMLLYKDTYLFSGDSLAVHNKAFHVESPAWTWQDYETLIRSVSQLSQYKFSWILPDHGGLLNFKHTEVVSRVALAIDEAKSVTINFREQIQALEIYINQLIGFGQTTQLEKMRLKLSEMKTLLKN